jgi:hypothetical protein
MTAETTTSTRRPARLRTCAKAAVVLVMAAGHGDLPLAAPVAQETPPNVVRSIVEGHGAPAWLALPQRAQMVLPDGVRLEVVSTAIISHEEPRQAALVGVFRNAGRPLAGLTLTLAFVGPDGESVVWSSPDAAGISEVATGASLPFRFPLVPMSTLHGPVMALRVTLEEAGAPRGRPVETRLLRHAAKQAGGDATVLAGEIELAADEIPAPSLRLSALLLDRNQQNLDVLVGEATPVAGKRYRFELRGTLPVASRTRSVRIWAQAPR